MNDNKNKKSSASQCARIYKYLLEGKTIHYFIAVNAFRCARLPERIREIKKKHNLEIGKGWIKIYGRNYRTYWIIKEGEHESLCKKLTKGMRVSTIKVGKIEYDDDTKEFLKEYRMQREINKNRSIDGLIK